MLWELLRQLTDNLRTYCKGSLLEGLDLTLVDEFKLFHDEVHSGCVGTRNHPILVPVLALAH